MEQRRLTLEQARALRLVRLGLAPDAPGAPRLTSPAEVAAHHLAMQGQDFPAVTWAVASRLLHTPRHRRDDVLAAYDDGSIVRTWPMRGTVHVLAAADARWLLDLCGPVALRSARRRHQTLGLDEAFIATVHRVAAESLRGGQALSRDELTAAWTEAGLDFSESARRYHSVWHICQTGLALLGPTRGGENLVVLTDEFVPDAVRLSTDEALAALGRRYLTAHGPATLEDLQHWTKLTKTQCRASLAAVGDDLVGVDVEGHHQGGLLALADQLDAATELEFGENVPRALVLPAFDEHILGFRDRCLVLDPDHAHHVYPGHSGVFRHTVVLDGRVVGIWRRRMLTSTAPVTVSLFEAVGARDRRLLERAFEPWGHHVGREPVVEFS